MNPFVWDEWPQFFRGRLRVLYELRGEVVYQPRPQLPWYWPRHRRARLPETLISWRATERGRAE